MEQFNPSTYKKDGAAKEFTHSCLGKIIIVTVIAIILMIIAALTRPSDSMMVWQMEDNIHECLGRQHNKSRNITLPTKIHIVKAMVFPVVLYGCESCTIKKAECQIDAF